MSRGLIVNPKKSAASGLRLLVVEDHRDTRRGLEAFVKALGWKAAFANDFESALATGTRESFDVLLSDLNLPDGNGWELIKRLRSRQRCPRHAIAISGYGTEEDMAKSKAAGFAVHLVKPIRPEELETVLGLAKAKLLGAAGAGQRNNDVKKPSAKRGAHRQSKPPGEYQDPLKKM